MGITWLAGYPKSGTTWLRAFLSAYVHGSLDINDLQSFTWDDLPALIWQSILSKPLPDLTPADGAMYRGAALHATLIASQDKITLRTHSTVGLVNEFPLIPTCLTERAIQVVRDPRDIAVSLAHFLSCTQEDAVKSLGEATTHVKQPGLYWFLGNWSDHVMSWENAPFPVETIRYEDMLVKPAATFEGQVLEFLGIEFDYDRFMAGYKLTDFTAMQAQECDNGFGEMKLEGKFFRRGQAGAWKDELKPELAERIIDQHGETMKYFGYTD